MPSGFMPNPDASLLLWSANFNRLINLSAESYGLTPELAAQYGELYDLFAAAMQTASDPGTRTAPAVMAKNRARENMKSLARRLAKRVEATAGVRDPQRVQLGLTVRAAWSRIQPPMSAPMLDVVRVTGRTVTLLLHDSASTTKRGKPDGVAAASVFSFVAPSEATPPPKDPAGWRYRGNFTRTNIELSFDAGVPAGSTVWLTAYWINPRSQSGPAGAPISTVLAGGIARAA